MFAWSSVICWTMRVYSVFCVCLIVVLLTPKVTGFCLYGDEPGCYFPCRCSQRSECKGEGKCASGCQTDTTDFHTPWRGPGCQIGNVALYKTASQNGGVRTADRAVDGKQELNYSLYCTETNTGGRMVAEWRVDLGDIYKIYNVTIYNRKGYFAYRMQNFVILTSNDSMDTLVCHRHTTPHIPAGTGTTFTCNQPHVGRFVHISRTGRPESNLLTLCEVIVIGHKYIDCSSIDCSRGSCNDVTGCSACHGTYQPACTLECIDRSFGMNCAEKCGNCSANQICDKVTGKCSGGCQLWWADDTCKTQIDPPRLHNETDTLEGAAVSNSSVVLQWVQMYSVPASLAEYYQYTVMYRVNTSSSRSRQIDNVSDTIVPHNASNRQAVVAIANLGHNTRYDFMVVPQRVMNGATESVNGVVYDPIFKKTNCINPNTMTLEFSVSGYQENGAPAIGVTYQDMSSVESGCDGIVNASAQYRLNEANMNFISESIDVSATSQIVLVNGTGQYVVRILVVNNEQLVGISSEQYVDVENNAGSVTSIIQIVVPTVLLLVLVLVAVVLAVFFYKRKKLIGRDPNAQNFTNLVTVMELDKRKSNDMKDVLSIDPEDSENNVQNNRSSPIKPVIKPKPSLNPKVHNEGTEENIYVNNTVIPVDQFEDYVTRRKADMDDFKAEYDSLPEDDFSRCSSGQTELNIKKNRFKNIFPYDDSRVVLHTDEENQTSYINANYISSSRSPREYIATQGPLKTTVTDFWRMIWQTKANRIVMVANLKENMKQRCHPYWSVDTGSSLEFGPFTVTTEGSERCADYVTSILTLQRGSQQMTMRHFHFTTWVDKDKPIYGATSLLTFYRKVHSFDNMSKGPLVVHCSAGVGRTGTFIVLDSLMKKIQVEGTVDVKASVQKARMERMTLVQTKAQYFFIHDVLVEFIKCKDIPILCSSFSKTYEELTGTDFVLKQFKILQEALTTTEDVDKKGLTKVHIKKNRNKDVIPSDSDRPHLMGPDDESYINAVFVDSFMAHDHYVVTQMPLPHTVEDFWRLVHTLETSTIIMLNQPPEGGMTNEVYWPAEGETAEYGGVDVSLVESKTVSESLITRDFRIGGKGHRSVEQTIRQFHLLTWPDDTVLPCEPGDVLDLVDHVGRWEQRKTKSCNPLVGSRVVHCIDGVAHSGMYCALTYLLDRMKPEQDVDPFLAARSVSRNRPEFFSNDKQYQFLYKMAAEYLSRNNDYANC